MSRLEDLILRSQNQEQDAKEQLIRENSGLIWSVARRFSGRGVETDDLYQLGCLGFLKAVEGFDRNFGTQFSTYAVPKIAGEIRRFLRDDGTVKVSRSIKERAATVRIAQSHLTNQLGCEPTVEQLAAYTGLTPEEIAIAESATASVESIQQATGEEGLSLENVLTDTESEDVMLERITLRQAIDALPEREAKVIRLRYFHALTQERVSKVLGVSQVQISRIEKKALGMLKEMIK